MNTSAKVIFLLSGLVMLLSLVGAIPSLAVENKEADDTGFNDQEGYFFNLARRSSSLELPGSEDFERQRRSWSWEPERFYECIRVCAGCPWINSIGECRTRCASAHGELSVIDCE